MPPTFAYIFGYFRIQAQVLNIFLLSFDSKSRMAVTKVCRFAEVAWVTLLGTFYGSLIFSLLFKSIAHFLHLRIYAAISGIPVFIVAFGFATIIGMCLLGREYYRNNPVAITVARILISVGIVYTLFALWLNVWLLYIHPNVFSLLYLIKVLSTLVGNIILVRYFIKSSPDNKTL